MKNQVKTLYQKIKSLRRLSLLNRVSRLSSIKKASSKRASIYIGNNKALTKTIYGHKMIVDTNDLSLSPHLILDGYWEKWITKVFLDLIQPGMHVVDIGANMGYYSLLAGEKIGSTGHLTCFEANPKLTDLIFYNLHLNGFKERSTVENKAVFSETKMLELSLYEKYSGGSSLWGSEAQAIAYRDNIKTIKVDGIALDDYFPKNYRLDFIKIDAEGAEPHILRGAKRIINTNPQIQIMMEFSPNLLEKSLVSVEEIYEEIYSLDFKIYEIKTDSSLHELPLERAKKISWTDVILKKVNTECNQTEA